MFYPVVEVLATFFEEFFLLCISDLFYEKRIKSNRHWAMLLLFCSMMTGLVIYLNGIALYSYETLAIWVLPATLVVFVLHRCNIIQACCLSILYMVIISSFDFLFLIFVEYALKAPEFVMAVLTGNCVERVITLIIAKSSLALVYFIIKMKKWKVNVSITVSLILIVFSVLSFISMQYLIEAFFLSEYNEMQEIILIAFAFMALFFLSVLLVLNGQEKVRRKAKEKELIEAELRISKEHDEGMIETYREIAKVSHDFKNQMRVTVLMLKNGRVAEACDYLAGIVESSAYKSTNYTGISSIDTVLSEKRRVAEEKNININLDISLSTICDIDPTDVCTVLLNLIDNAIEACLKMGNEQAKEIKVILKNVNSMVLIKVENTTREINDLKDDFSLLKTTKANKVFHGLGLKIVNSVAEKYNGSLIIKHDNNIFNATVLLSR